MNDYALHTCRDRSHAHLSKAEYDENLHNGLIEILSLGDPRRQRKAVVRVVRTLSVRGLSCSVGAGIVMMLSTDSERSVALTMLSEIRNQREARADEPL